MQDTILVADDDPDVVSALRYLLQTEGYEVVTADSPAKVMALIRQRDFPIVLMDLNYRKDTTSGQEGLELLPALAALEPSPAVIAMTAWGSIETAVKAMQAGARDFIQKPWENERLLAIIGNQLRLTKSERRSQRLSEENKLLRNALKDTGDGLFCRSPVMRKVMDDLQKVAGSDASLLLTGENGTGKSFLVDHVHCLSPRREGPLIKVNMGAITESLFESEMFGHEKGAFTDAARTHIGRFELAEGGTLFLDEVGNTPFSQQAKLLRVLEDGHFERVGGSHTHVADCRLICATNGNLEAAVTAGHFRQDLLYRINTVVINVPPLRERSEDILPFAEHFLALNRARYNKPDLEFSTASRGALKAYTWPGNVRELAHLIERASILAQEVIEPDVLGVDPRQESKLPDRGSAAAELTLAEIERQVIAERLESCDGNSQLAAESLGLSKSAFYRHLKKHELK
ncbi:MAG: sigma-54 dependent transcriptional regulator [Gammaproteobacteria bacterium]|nr:sigma-54-dependent Fis family transcriptional regulator [Pseudomonadales bacterium]